MSSIGKKNLTKNDNKNVGKCKMRIAISVSPFSFALSLRSWKEEMADDKITMDGIIHRVMVGIKYSKICNHAPGCPVSWGHSGVVKPFSVL